MIVFDLARPVDHTQSSRILELIMKMIWIQYDTWLWAGYWLVVGIYKPWNGVPWGLRWKRICLQCRRPGFDPWVRKIPWRRERLLTPAFLPGESHGQRSLAGYNPWCHKESDMTELLTLSLSHTMESSWPPVQQINVFISTFQITRLRPREAKWLAQGHTA